MSLVVDVLKWACTSGAISAALFITQYTNYSPWRKDPIGRTVVYRDIATIFALTPLILSLWFHLSSSASQIVAWVYIVAISMITPIMLMSMSAWYRGKKNNTPEWEDPVIRSLQKFVSRIKNWRLKK